MTQVKVVTKSVLRRDWLNVEPKLVAGGIAALSSTQVVALIVGHLNGSHNVILVEFAALIPTLAFLLVGYLKASTHKGELLAKVERDLPDDLDALAHEAAAANLIPAAVATRIGVFSAIDHAASNIADVAPVPVTEPIPALTPTTIVLPGEPTPTLPQQ